MVSEEFLCHNYTPLLVAQWFRNQNPALWLVLPQHMQVSFCSTYWFSLKLKNQAEVL